jgi:hypothetical protein
MPQLMECSQFAGKEMGVFAELLAHRYRFIWVLTIPMVDELSSQADDDRGGVARSGHVGLRRNETRPCHPNAHRRGEAVV